MSQLLRGGMALVALVSVPLACSGEEDACPGAQTRLCLPDGETCTCAPACTPDKCAGYELCGVNQTCRPCVPTSGPVNCGCSGGLCVPVTWSEGEQVGFQKLGKAASHLPPAPPADASTDARLGSPNPRQAR